MAKVRCVLKHVRIEFAGGQRRCKRNRNHSIGPGQPCLVIQDDGAPFSKCYCSECALPIMKQCADDLRKLRDIMYGGPITAESRPNRPVARQESLAA